MPATPRYWPTLVRTDRHNHRSMAGDSLEVEAIKVLARGHQNLIWTRTRHTNALRSALREYYPAALEAFDDLADRDALAVLGRAPTPADAAQSEPVKDPLCPQTRWAGNATSTPVLRRSRRRCAPSNSPLPRAVTAAFAATTRAAVGIIIELNRQITELEAELADTF